MGSPLLFVSIVRYSDGIILECFGAIVAFFPHVDLVPVGTLVIGRQRGVSVRRLGLGSYLTGLLWSVLRLCVPLAEFGHCVLLKCSADMLIMHEC